jgi:hypothetical protein
MAESEARRQVSVARERTEGPGGLVAVAGVVLIAAAFVAGWRSKRRWDRLMGW